MAVPPNVPVTRRVPSGEKATSPKPVRVSSAVSVMSSRPPPSNSAHTFVVPSLLAVASSAESGLQATARTQLLWPGSTVRCWPVSASCTCAAPDSRPMAMSRPSGLHATSVRPPSSASRTKTCRPSATSRTAPDEEAITASLVPSGENDSACAPGHEISSTSPPVAHVDHPDQPPMVAGPGCGQQRAVGRERRALAAPPSPVTTSRSSPVTASRSRSVPSRPVAAMMLPSGLSTASFASTGTVRVVRPVATSRTLDVPGPPTRR